MHTTSSSNPTADDRASLPTVVGKSGGVSWQASVLNFLARHLIKRRIERHGIASGTVRTLVRLLDFATVGLHGFTTVHRKTIAGVPCDVVYPSSPPPTER